jgi:hypothetical protein
MFGLLPKGVGEALLLFFVLLAGFLVIRSVRRRHEHAAPVPTGEEDALPTLTTQQRVTGVLRRVYRDAAQGVWLAEIALGKRKFTFCATDYAAQAEHYAALVGKEADIALFAFATLAPGGADAMKEQNLIKDEGKVRITPDLVRLIPHGTFANDYVVIARVLSRRGETLDGEPLAVYRAQVVRADDLTLVLELAAQPADAPFPDQSMVHGSARLCGYLSG